VGLLPLLSSSSLDGGEYVGVGRTGYDDDMTLQRGIAMSCLRMPSVSLCATWRVTACRCAATVLLRQLNSEMGPESSSSPPSHQILWKQPLSNNKTTTPRMMIIPSTIVSSVVLPETLAGTSDMLIIALRGILT